VATCGALLSFLFIQFPESKLLDENIKLYGFILVPIIAMLYDVMIAKNVYSIHCIGLFIRDKIEEEHFPFMKLWEKYVGQRKKKERNYGWFDIALLTLFTLVTIIHYLCTLTELE
jgi:hypothetical protein